MAAGSGGGGLCGVEKSHTAANRKLTPMEIIARPRQRILIMYS
jgi:hypothetical protein